MPHVAFPEDFRPVVTVNLEVNESEKASADFSALLTAEFKEKGNRSLRDKNGTQPAEIL